MASESDILVRTRNCKPIYDGDLAHIISGDTETSKTWADKSKEYADEAAASAAEAAASAEATAGSVEAAAGYAESAEASAQAAAQSAEGIQEALEAAEAARDTAVASGNAAQTAASAASQSAQSARSNAQGAAASATGAASSAQQAAGSASSAAQAAARAAGSATNAGVSKTAAEAARDLAMTYARQAQEAGSGSSEDAEKARQAATEAALSAVSAAASAEEAKGVVTTVTEARDEAVAAGADAVAAKNTAVSAKNAAAASAAAADEDRALALAYAQSAERSKNSAGADAVAAMNYKTGAEQARDRAILEAAAAGGQKDLAKRWATSMTVVEDGLYGARKYAVDASEASGEAGEAVQDAQEAQRLAEQARDAAAGSATTAAGKASEASDSAVAAAGSASAAAVTKGQVDTLHDATLDVYEATANTYDDVVEVYGWAAKASADAQGHANDALVARRGAEAAQDAAETAEESAEAWASKGDHTPVEGELYSSKEYAERAAASAAEAEAVAELVQDAAIQGRNNTFTQTNTFNGAVALNGATTKPASAEAWTSNTVMTLGMHQVGAWWDELEADMLFNPEKTELSGNALMILEGTTDAVQIKGVDGSAVSGKGKTANTNLSASDLVAGRITLNPRAQVKIAAAGTSEDNGSATAFADDAHKWLWITWHKKYKQRDINLIGAYAAANSCPVVLVCDTVPNQSSSSASRPVTTKIVDAYLCSAPARNTAAGKADTICLVLVGAKKGITDLYIGFKGATGYEKRLMRHYTLPQFGFGEIGTISTTNYLPSVTAARGNLATSGAVTHKMDMWAYQGTYQPTDPAGSAAFFVKDAQTGMGEGYSNTKYDVVQQQTMKVYLADVQTEQPTTDPAAYTFSATPHDNKDDVLVPAAGGYVLAKIQWYWGPGTIRYHGSSALAQAVVMDSWLVDTEAGAEADGMVMGKASHGYGTWTLSKAVTDTFDGWGGTITCYAYIKVPENTTGAERDGYAVVGISGMRASLIHIVQAAN